MLSESATVAYENLQRAYGGHPLSRTQVFKWHKSFLKGRELVEDEPQKRMTKWKECGEVRSSIDVENDQY